MGDERLILCSSRIGHECNCLAALAYQDCGSCKLYYNRWSFGEYYFKFSFSFTFIDSTYSV